MIDCGVQMKYPTSKKLNQTQQAKYIFTYNQSLFNQQMFKCCSLFFLSKGFQNLGKSCTINMQHKNKQKWMRTDKMHTKKKKESSSLI